jgi:hypothetical protein
VQNSCGGRSRPSNGGGRRSRSSWPRRWRPSAAVDAAASDADAVPELAADIDEHEDGDEDEHTACSCTSSSAAAAAASWPSPPRGTAWPSIAAAAADAAATASTAAAAAVAAAAAAAACSHHRRSFAAPCSLLSSNFVWPGYSLPLFLSPRVLDAREREGEGWRESEREKRGRERG